MTVYNAHSLTKSNAHFQKALKRLPLASTFWYWGDDRAVCVKHHDGGREAHNQSCLADFLWACEISVDFTLEQAEVVN